MARTVPPIVLLGLLLVSGLMLADGGPSLAAGIAQAPATTAAPVDRQFVADYCVACHNARAKTAGLALDTANFDAPGSDAEIWEKVIRKLRSGAMPPPGRPAPASTTRAAFIEALETALDRAALAAPEPGRHPALHRLNRAEYANAVRDLLAMDIDVASLLPADDADANGFDNMAEVLSISPALLQRYVGAAKKISRLAIGRDIGISGQSQELSKLLYQDDRMNADLPLGSRGGASIHYRFPVDGKYGLKIRLQRNVYGYIRGMDNAHQLDVWVDGTRIKSYTVGGEKPGAPPPLSYAGNIEGSPEWEKYYTHDADAGLDLQFQAKAGTRVIGVAFRRERVAPEGVLQPRSTGWGLAMDDMSDKLPAVEVIEITGPHEDAGAGDARSRARIFTCRPTSRTGEEPCAKRILSTLARRAYRRPVSDKDVDPLLNLYRAARHDGDFDAGIQSALEMILADPEFLFRIERDPARAAPGTVNRISDLELASRLSFFLWSSIPDDELLDLAARGRLKDPVVLERQVRRMVADARSKALVENFAGQWLLLRNIQTVAPDPDTFPDFDENLREAFHRETELFFESQLREDRSLADLLSANYTFLNERLARHYGIRGVYGSHFRRVTLNGDTNRVGLLGQGSVLLVTSYPDRTSPVTRGKWLLENVFGTPPPPPPENVPPLPQTGENGEAQSVRERLEKHRRNPACAVCHAPMDPLGLALENFDGIGAWRTVSEAGTPIDANSALPDGTKIVGARGLRELLVSHRENFVVTVTEKLLAYAIGRPVSHVDAPVIRQLVREAARADYRWSAIVLGIVRSTPFLMRRTES